MTRKLVAAVGTALALLTGCGGDDDGEGATGDVSDEARPYVDALVESAENSDSDVPFEAGEAECLAPRWVDILDPTRLEEAGIAPEDLAGSDDAITELDLTEEDGGALYDAMVECGVDVRDEFIAGIAEESDLSEEDRACLEEQFDDDFLRRIFVVVLTQGEDALQADQAFTSEVLSKFSECPGALPEG